MTIVDLHPQLIERARALTGERSNRSVLDGFPLERAPDESLVLDIQDALRSAGLVRAAGPLDTLVAGCALADDATVLTSDQHSGHIARVTDLQHEHLAPTS